MRGKSRWLMSAVGLAALTVPVMSGAAAGASSPGPNHASVDILGSDHFVHPGLLTNDFRFSPERIVIAQGGTITFHNQTTDGHTIALVDASALPKNTGEVDNCGAPGTVCSGVNKAFGLSQNGGPPKVFQIDNGKHSDDNSQDDADATDVSAGTVPPGFPPALIEDFDTPSTSGTVGDATIIAPKGNSFGVHRTIVVTAAPGLYHYMCTIHPWMQGEIQVTS